MIVDTYVSDALSKVRKNIDEVDLQLMELLLKRFALAKKAAGEKPSEDSVYDPLREKQIVNSAIEYFKKNDLGIETTFVKTVFENILAESRKQVEQEFIRLKGAKQ
ncbi:MAG: chorismate mutase [Bacteroidia bacterium]